MAHQCAGQAHLGLARSDQVAGRRRTEERAVASIVSGLAAALGHMSGWVAITLIAVLVFGETAIFLGFVRPGEAAVVFGGVLASRGHLSLPLLIGVVVVTAVTGPMVGYEIGKRMGDRLFTTPTLPLVSGPLDPARTTHPNRGADALLARPCL